ncbi:MAG: DegT/DnrJ/EryC1/StrS family aminotransferase [Bacteroidota bacterium]
MIPFSPPRIDDDIINEVVAALKSGWITTGPRTKQFEKEVAEYCGVEKFLAVNSWTAGAEMLLHWFGVQEGDEVIVPAYTYCASANIVVHCGAKPVMVDVNDDFTINIEAVRKAITSKTKVILPVDVGGLPVNYDALMQMVQEPEIQKLFNARTPRQEKLNRIMVLNDAAHSFGAIYKGKRIGTACDFTVFSFHAVKNLTTAEGGGICINMPKPFDNDELYKELNIYSLHGQSKDALAKMQKGAWEYDVIDAGYKCNMTDILASIGLIELRRYDAQTLKRRKEIFEVYQNAFSKLDWAITPIYKDADRESSYHLYLLRIKGFNVSKRNEMIQHIFDKDVSVNVHYKPLPLLTAYSSRGYQMSDYPNAQALWENEISLPVFYDMSDAQLQEVIDAVIKSYQETI